MKTAKRRGFCKSFKPTHPGISKFENPELLAAIAAAAEGHGKDFVISRLNHPEIMAMMLGEIAAKIETWLAPATVSGRRRYRKQISIANPGIAK